MAYRTDRFIPDSSGTEMEYPENFHKSQDLTKQSVASAVAEEILKRTISEPHWEKTGRSPIQQETAEFAINIMRKFCVLTHQCQV